MLEEYKALNRKWKIYVMHHTHTDIGYTDSQEVITDRQIDYIKQAIELSEAIAAGERKEWKGFKWICEAFWGVERFLGQADEQLKERLKSAVERGDIEITGNYLNLNEAIDYDTLRYFTGKARAYADETGVPMNSAMTADINGYSWGYSQVLFDAGIKNLLSCVHSHHGMFPIFRKQIPFYWETPKGDKLLVWNGDHYQLGNEMGIVPDAVHSYVLKDEFNAAAYMENQFGMAEKRIYRYLKQLEKEEYPFDFVPLSVTGLVTDNAPPNGRIMDFINQWNGEYSEKVSIEMITLDDFFDLVRESKKEIKTYRGDWPDWWSDGLGASFEFTKLLRKAQRAFKAIKKLDENNEIITKEQSDRIYYDIMMYSEHTFSYSASMEEPWADMVKVISNQKHRYAIEANQLCNAALNQITKSMGEVILRPERPMIFKVVNPYDHLYTNIYHIYIDSWEKGLLKDGFEVIDVETNTSILYQINGVARGMELCIDVTLKAKEEKIVAVKLVPSKQYVTIRNDYLKGVEGVADIKNGNTNDEVMVEPGRIETQSLRIEWSYPEGITGWYDKALNKELLRPDKKHNAFSPIYEITPLTKEADICSIRAKMGRNRKGESVNRFTGQLKNAKIINNGSIFTDVEFTYEFIGTSFYTMVVRVFHNSSRVDVSIRMNKDSVWEPENIYVALPFGLYHGRLWIEKMGSVLRPGIDQLPGTNADFYSIQEGLGYLDENEWIAISTPDAPLIQLGTLEYRYRELNENKSMEEQSLYSWPMNNFWETNFDAAIGGFHQLNYSILSGSGTLTPEELIRKTQDMNGLALCFRIDS